MAVAVAVGVSDILQWKEVLMCYYKHLKFNLNQIAVPEKLTLVTAHFSMIYFLQAGCVGVLHS